MKVDTSQLDQLVQQLEHVGDDLPDGARQVVQRGALNIKTDWRQMAKVSAGKHGKLYPYSITYDTEETRTRVTAEIGPERDRPQGGMAFETGSVNQPPHPDGQRAADREEPRFAKAVEEMAARLLDGLGG